MAVEWGLAGRGGYNYLDSLQQIGNAQAQQQALQLNQQRAQQQAYAFEQAQRQDAQRVQLAERARAGDFAGARQEAALGGDFQYAEALGSLRQDQLQQLNREFDVIGRLHPTLKTLPVEQRAQTALPLLKQAGFTDDELAGVDWTDAGLDGAYALSEAGKAALAARLKQQEARVVGDGGALVDGTGRVLYENQKAAEWQFDPESGSWLQKPGTGTGGGGVPSTGGGTAAGGSAAPVSGRTQYGWTPRERNGGDNSDAAVDGKIAGMARALGISPDQDLSGLSDTQIAQALTLSEGGRGSIADRNNNPGNLRDTRTGAYRRFGTKEEGLAAAAAQVRRNRARGQNTIRTMVEGLPVGGGARSGGGQTQQQPGVINVRAPRDGYRVLTDAEKQQRGLDANTQYQVGPRGQITTLGSRTASLTEGQSKAVGFLERAVAAQNSLNQISGYNPSTLAQNLDRLGTSNPFRSGLSQTDRRALSGIRAFVLAVLRQDSGAAIAKDEFDQMAQTLFPLPGDGPEVQADKRAQREAALRALRTAAGPGSESVQRVRANPNDRNARENRRRLGVGQSFNGGGIKITRVQ